MMVYKEANTPIHRMNAMPKIIWAITILILSLIFDNPVVLILLFVATIPPAVFGKIIKEWSFFVKFGLFFIPVIVLLNIAFNHNGEHILYSLGYDLPFFGSPVITLEALFYGIMMGVRLLVILSAFAIITVSVHPDDILMLMLKMKVPYKSVLIVSLSSRFIPTLLSDVETITDVQRTRGLELDRGSIIKRIKNRFPVLVPLLANSLERSVEIAEAMEARAFGENKKRTFYKELKLSNADKLVSVFIFSTLLVGIIARFLGYGIYEYYPVLSPIELESIILGVLLFSMLVIPYVSVWITYNSSEPLAHGGHQ
ncbi:hypothetical protein DRN72_00690 [Methanosarcinales archaeon]|nr:MAG: hypothetical protein DRN72_00690 [Methanosarcinales archaeon]